ncbi:MAG: spermidine synthase [Thermoplasmata archaeon]|nr:MAG: spermidine synthase [Thermoplasmata archaeon]
MSDTTDDDNYVCEQQTETMRFCLKCRRVLYRGRSKYQEILVVDTYDYGKALLLDGLFQTTEKDEAFYHELLVHVPMFAHPSPKNVLIIGGGDGGSLREALKHRVHVDLVEIDEEVVEISKKYFFFPDSGNFDLIIMDGFEYLKSIRKKYDVVIVDGSDPIGPAEVLFKDEFVKLIKKVLEEKGIVVLQSGSPLLREEYCYFFKIYKTLKKYFKLVKPYFYFVPTYPTGMWSYIAASDTIDPEVPARIPDESYNLKVYTEKLHRSVFALPSFIEKKLKEEQ